MIKRSLACVLLIIISFGCAREAQTNTPITWRADEDEIILYLDFSSEASSALINLLNEPVTFKQASDFLVQNTDSKIPFFEGALAAAALTSRSVEFKAEMEKKLSRDGITMEIIGFQENPVKIVKGALDFSQAPEYLVEFDPNQNPQVVNKLIDLMSGNDFVVEVYGRFPEQ
jgi:hypothetical protein